MNLPHIGEPLFVDCPPTSVTFPDGSNYQSCGPPTEKTDHDSCESRSQPQTVRMDVDEMQADCHAPWASSALPTPELFPETRVGSTQRIILGCRRVVQLPVTERANLGLFLVSQSRLFSPYIRTIQGKCGRRHTLDENE